MKKTSSMGMRCPASLVILDQSSNATIWNKVGVLEHREPNSRWIAPSSSSSMSSGPVFQR